MRRLHTGALTALVLVLGMTATTANAQALRGFHADVDVGATQFSAAGDHDTSLGWGAAAGVDFDLGGFVLGAEGTFWWPGACFQASHSCPTEVHTRDGAGFVDEKSFQEYALAARAGVMVTPSTLVYGKVGYAWNEQRKRFTPDVGVCGGNACQPAGYYHHYTAKGVQWGGGIEQMVSGPFYVKAEGRYSNYDHHTHAITGLLGFGVLFGAAAAAPPPPPPPPPAPERG